MVRVFDAVGARDEWVDEVASTSGVYFAVGPLWGAVAPSRAPIETFAKANSGNVIAP